jgi:hypothetical protein
MGSGLLPEFYPYPEGLYNAGFNKKGYMLNDVLTGYITGQIRENAGGNFGREEVIFNWK